MLMLLTQVPLGVAEQAALLPAVSLSCIWFWSLFRPDSLPSPVVFVIGLLMDLLGYLPLGAGLFTLLVVHAVALGMRGGLQEAAFAWIWMIFGGVAAGASLLLWLLVMLLTFRLLSPAPACFMAVVTIAIFPVLAVPFAVADRSIANPERA